MNSQNLRRTFIVNTRKSRRWMRCSEWLRKPHFWTVILDLPNHWLIAVVVCFQFEIEDYRKKKEITIRGSGCPKPIIKFHQAHFPRNSHFWSYPAKFSVKCLYSQYYFVSMKNTWWMYCCNRTSRSPPPFRHKVSLWPSVVETWWASLKLDLGRPYRWVLCLVFLITNDNTVEITMQHISLPLPSLHFSISCLLLCTSIISPTWSVEMDL